MDIYPAIRPLDYPTRKGIYDKSGIDVPIEFSAIIYGIGDDTGAGTMSGDLPLATYFGTDFYFALTSINWRTSDSGQTVEAIINSDNWFNPKQTGGSGVLIAIWGNNQCISGGYHRDQLDGILYLGKPVTTGIVTFAFADHAGTSTYLFYVTGYGLAKPLPSSAIHQNNPIG